METFDFEQIVAKTGSDLLVTLSRQLETKTIEIALAADWISGKVEYECDKAKGAWRKTGFIGRGGTKHGIYVSSH